MAPTWAGPGLFNLVTVDKENEKLQIIGIITSETTGIKSKFT